MTYLPDVYLPKGGIAGFLLLRQLMPNHTFFYHIPLYTCVTSHYAPKLWNTHTIPRKEYDPLATIVFLNGSKVARATKQRLIRLLENRRLPETDFQLLKIFPLTFLLAKRIIILRLFEILIKNKMLKLISFQI